MQMTQRYAHLSSEHLKEAHAKMGRKIFREGGSYE